MCREGTHKGRPYEIDGQDYIFYSIYDFFRYLDCGFCKIFFSSLRSRKSRTGAPCGYPLIYPP